ncbi:pterin-4-alpha-carbinolamine dehydratase 2, mitochondrial isoform X2 [Dendrobium catenatum]|uniref:pterin-4-alpha-carbinolamine dehydratase 2, mitochondrial isoform X2 n=1 Tax=Dendrobium catenatum TaxID=906689 RepID=UPI0009F165ED|nr:pterin-4-alpha-carbinolamine dehydratase 2, mitochondrial isoform X2 [Dendrobium catenatum]
MIRFYAQSRFLNIAKTVRLLRLVSSSDSLSNRNGRSLYWISKIPSRHVLQATAIRSFSACSASQDLTTKKCVPCNSKHIQLMAEQNANELLKQRSWRVKSFTKGLEFFQLVADIAEAEGHHPDLHLFGWNNVKIEIWTHSVGGLTENDFILAAKINSLKLEHLLSKKTASNTV